MMSWAVGALSAADAADWPVMGTKGMACAWVDDDACPAVVDTVGCNADGPEATGAM